MSQRTLRGAPGDGVTPEEGRRTLTSPTPPANHPRVIFAAAELRANQERTRRSTCSYSGRSR